jgi:hypothetical protein
MQMQQLFTGARDRVQQLVQDNATTILTAGGVVGTVGTALLAGRAGYRAAELIMAEEARRLEAVRMTADPTIEVKVEPLTKMEVAQLVGLQFAPPVLAGSATVASIILANRMSAQKAAALAAAYGLAEKNLNEYKDKVQEKLTGPKATAIRDEIQQDRVNENPPRSREVIIIGSGEVLCYDAWSGRYFKTSVEAIRRAENAVNKEIMQSNEASLRSFYDELELPPVTMDEQMGWNINHPLGVEISTVLTPEEEPCLAIEFTELPIMDFRIRY